MTESWECACTIPAPDEYGTCALCGNFVPPMPKPIWWDKPFSELTEEEHEQAAAAIREAMVGLGDRVSVTITRRDP